MPIFEDCGYQIEDHMMYEAVKASREYHQRHPDKDIRIGYYAAARRYGVNFKGADSIASHMGKISQLIKASKRDEVMNDQLDVPMATWQADPVFKAIFDVSEVIKYSCVRTIALDRKYEALKDWYLSKVMEDHIAGGHNPDDRYEIEFIESK